MYDLIETLQSTNISLNLDFLSNGLGILAYILQALALYTIAKRRGIRKPGLAWIPFGNSWILGSLSDQYHYVTKREIKNKRKKLLGAQIASSVLVVAFVVVLAVILFQLLFSAEGTMEGWIEAFNSGEFEATLEDAQNVEHFGDFAGIVLLLIAICVLLIGVAITYQVVFWMAMYDLFRSCEPEKSTMYLVISLVGNFMVSGLYSVFMMLCKDKDLGMPPRKQEVEVLYTPEQPEE